MQSARVYRSYLRKLHLQNQKEAIENQQLDRQSEALSEHTQNIAKDFCNWAVEIRGEDPKCNPTEEEILNWFAVGQDALEFQDTMTGPEKETAANNDNNLSMSKAKYAHSKGIQKLGSISNLSNKRLESDRTTTNWIFSEHEKAMELKRMELETKLQNLNSTALLRDFKNKKNCESEERSTVNNNYVV